MLHSFRLYCTFIALCCVQILTAQSYVPGTITFLSGTTQDGQITLPIGTQTPETVFFKGSDGKEHTYGLQDLQEFVLRKQDGEQERYIRKTVQLLDSRPLSEVTFSAQPSFQKKTVFLEQLLDLPIRLYQHKLPGAASLQFFVEAPGDTIQTLVVWDYYSKTQNDGRAIRVLNRYRNQLKVLSKDCPDLFSKIDKTRYNTADMRKMVRDINFCLFPATKQQFVSQKNRHSAEWVVSAGVALTSMRVPYDIHFNPVTYLYDSTDYPLSVRPVLAVGCNLYVNGTNRRALIRTELSWRSYKSTIRQTYRLAGEDRSYFRRIQMDYLRVGTLLSYHVLRNQPSLLASFGPSLAYRLRSNSSYTNSFSPGEKPLPEVYTRQFEFGLGGGLGYKKKRLTVEARYEWALPADLYSVPAHHYMLIASYRISK